MGLSELIKLARKDFVVLRHKGKTSYYSEHEIP
jgi:hypothetical protein